MSETLDRIIGLGVCPVCGNTKARFTVSKKQLACMTCNACNIQIFARSDSSDEKLRGFIRAQKIDAPTPEQAVEVEQNESQKRADIYQKTLNQPTGFNRPGWGILGGL